MKKIIYIDIDDTLADFKGAVEKAKLVNPAMPFPQAEYGFYSNLIPLNGAIEAVKWFVNSDTFIPYLLTAPSVMNPMSYTEKRIWVEKHLGMNMVQRLIICSDKSLLKGTYLIDDKIEGHGQDEFEGTVLQYGSEMFPNWGDIKEMLKKETMESNILHRNFKSNYRNTKKVHLID